MNTGHFYLSGQKIPMQLGYRMAMNTLPEMGLDILKLANIQEQEDAQEIYFKLILDDVTLLKVWYYYISEAAKDGIIAPTTFDEALELLDESEAGLEPFRKAFWDLVVGFLPIALRPALKETKSLIERKLKETSERAYNTSTSSSPVEQD